jgi:hypothetical protein
MNEVHSEAFSLEWRPQDFCDPWFIFNDEKAHEAAMPRS